MTAAGQGAGPADASPGLPSPVSRMQAAALQRVFEHLSEGLVLANPAGEVMHWNRAALAMHGLTGPDGQLRPLSDLESDYRLETLDGQEVPVTEWPLVRTLRGEEVHGLVLRMRRLEADFSRIFSYGGSLVFDEAGRPQLGVLHITDVTEQARAERELHTAADSMAQAGEEIRRLNADLERRVAERTAELEAANAELESFAYAVAHDLRAPLRAMAGFARALMEDYRDRLEGEASEYVDEIIGASRTMGNLIDAMLSLSRHTRGGLLRGPVDVSAQAEHILRTLGRAEVERNVAWSVTPGLAAWGDTRMVDVVLHNLLSNAWKYTTRAASPRIEVTGEVKDGLLYVRVSDNGAGFSMAHAAKLFQPFQRLHRQDEFPGIGIGLATVQRIVRRHGGVVTAHGKPGEGAVFEFSLPLVPPAAAAG